MEPHNIRPSCYGEDLNYCNAAIVEIIHNQAQLEMTANRGEQEGELERVNVNSVDSSENNEQIEGIGNDQNNSVFTFVPDAETLRLRSIIRNFKSRLREEGASTRLLSYVSQAAIGAISPALNQIDYNR